MAQAAEEETSPQQHHDAGKSTVTLHGVAETLLITLAARAADAASARPVLGDPFARDVLDRLEYDFDAAARATGSASSPLMCAAVALRGRYFDRWTAAFLARQRGASGSSSSSIGATVLHLACGLDSRVQRVQWGDDDDDNVRWIDVDLPEVVELRRKVLPAAFPGRDYRLVGASVTDTAWLDEIPADRPTVVVMEGLLSYLTAEDATGLLVRLADKFGGGGGGGGDAASGSELLFTCINGAALALSRKGHIKAISRTGAELQWAVENLKELEELHPRLKLLELVRAVDAPGVEEFPLMGRLTFYLLSWIPSQRDSGRFVRFGLEGG